MQYNEFEATIGILNVVLKRVTFEVILYNINIDKQNCIKTQNNKRQLQLQLQCYIYSE